MSAGLRIRIYTDEMVPKELAPALRRAGYDAVNTQEAGRAGQGLSDEDQLTYATQQGRAILTRDVEDYSRLDRAWRTYGRAHAGIIVYRRTGGLSDLLRRVTRHLDATDPETQFNTVLFL